MCILQFPAGKKTGRWLVSPFQILAFDVKDSESWEQPVLDNVFIIFELYKKRRSAC